MDNKIVGCEKVAFHLKFLASLGCCGGGGGGGILVTMVIRMASRVALAKVQRRDGACGISCVIVSV